MSSASLFDRILCPSFIISQIVSPSRNSMTRKLPETIHDQAIALRCHKVIRLDIIRKIKFSMESSIRSVLHPIFPHILIANLLSLPSAFTSTVRLLGPGSLGDHLVRWSLAWRFISAAVNGTFSMPVFNLGWWLLVLLILSCEIWGFDWWI